MELIELNDKEYMKIVKEFLKMNGIPAKKDIVINILDNIHQIHENEGKTLYSTIIATSIYAALKISDYKMSMSQIAEFFTIDTTTISKCYNRN